MTDLDPWDALYAEEVDEVEAGWSAAFSGEVASSQQELEQMDEACGEAALSSSDTESSSSSAYPRFSVWWTRVLYDAVLRLGMQWPGAHSEGSEQGCVYVASACAGCSAECAVLQASLS